MINKLDNCLELLGLIDSQSAVIATQNGVIAKLISDNMEKENMIHALLEDEEGFY